MKSLVKHNFLYLFLTIFAYYGCKKNDDPDPSSILNIKSITPTSGVEGVKVVIQGTAFSPNLAGNIVMFGSVSATIDSVSTTRIVTKVPKGATTGKITVTVNSKSATSVSDFTVLVNPPVFDDNASANVSSGVTKTAAAVSSTLTGKGGQNITQYGHVWSKSNNPPTVADSKTELGALTATATFPFKINSSLQNLEGNTTYYVRAYATAGSTTTYGPVFQVKTKNFPVAWGGVEVLAEFPGPKRSSEKFFKVGKKLYVLGGTSSLVPFFNDLWEYDSESNKWTQKKDFPIKFDFYNNLAFATMVFGDQICLFSVYGSGTGGRITTVFTYNSTKNEWTERNKVPFTFPRGGGAFSIGSKGYIVGGSYPETPANKDVWEYDFTNDKWTKKNDFPGEARIDVKATSYNEKGYIAGGQSVSSGTDVWEYSPQSDQWMKKAAISNTYYFNSTIFSKGTSWYFENSSNYDVYNFTSNTWSVQQKSPDLYQTKYDPDCFPFSISGSNYSAQSIDDKIYIFLKSGGSCSSLDHQLWRFKL